MNERLRPPRGRGPDGNGAPGPRDGASPAPLRVLHVESGHEWRHTRNQVGLLVRGLRAHPHVYQAVACLARSRLAVESERAGVPTIPLPWATGSDPRALRMLARHVRHGWDVIHAHDSHALRLVIYLLALEGSPSRVVASRRVPTPPRAPWKWSRANLVLASDARVREVLIEAGISRRRVELVPDGVEAEGIEPRARGVLRDAAAAEDDHFLIGSLASLAPDRDHATLVRAAALVTARHPRARFALYGEGPTRRLLENLIGALDLGGRVCLPGYVPDARLSLGDLDLLVVPSLWGELTAGGLEALCAGVPVLLTADGDGRLRPEGIEAVRRGDPSAMAEAIGRFIEDEEYRNRMIAGARAHAAEHAVGELARRTRAAYEAVLRIRPY